jgi:hypothetical protein
MVGADSGLQGWLLPEDPFVETYLVRPGGATVFALAPDERVTVVDAHGGQVAELTALDEAGRDAAEALGAKADAPATVVREAFRSRNGSLLADELGSRGLDPAEATAVLLFGEWSPPGSSQAFRAERASTGRPHLPSSSSRCGGRLRGDTSSSSSRPRSPSRASISGWTPRPHSRTRCERVSSSR